MKEISKRSFMTTLGSLAALGGLGGSVRVLANGAKTYDVIVVGGGTAGMPAALFAAKRGAKVLIVDAAPTIGGTMFMTGGMLSAAGTKLQKSKGIVDSPQSHFDDVMRMSKGTANPDIVRLAVFNAADTFDWLVDRGMQVPAEFPIFGPPHHDAYSAARYVRGAEKGMSLFLVCMQELQPYIDNGQVDIEVNSEVTKLLQDASGRVIGIEARGQDGRSTVFEGRNIALTSGGYTSNSKLVSELEGAVDYAYNTYPYSQGGGIAIGLQAGGYLKGGENFLPIVGSVLSSDEYPSPTAGRLRFVPADRPLWEVLVNVHGKRFVNEDSETFHAYEDALSRQPGMRFWAVFDASILRDASPILWGSTQWTSDSIRKAFEEGTPMFYQANTIEELAGKSGVDKEGLVETIKRFNAGRDSGKDELGRKHMPRPIAEPPFYAIRAHGVSIVSFAGLAVDTNLRVLRKSGAPIEGLFAAGELLGAGQLMGRNYAGGMTLTPSLTFGRLLGQRFFSL